MQAHNYDKHVKQVYETAKQHVLFNKRLHLPCFRHFSPRLGEINPIWEGVYSVHQQLSLESRQ